MLFSVVHMFSFMYRVHHLSYRYVNFKWLYLLLTNPLCFLNMFWKHQFNAILNINNFALNALIPCIENRNSINNLRSNVCTGFCVENICRPNFFNELFVQMKQSTEKDIRGCQFIVSAHKCLQMVLTVTDLEKIPC